MKAIDAQPGAKKTTPRARTCPKMLHHTSGQAYAAWKVRGKRYHRYFGLWGSNAAWVAYDLFQRSWPEPLLEPKPSRPRPTPRLITHDGRTQNLNQWAREVGLKPGTLKHRLDVMKWPVAKALSTPARPVATCPRLQHDANRSMGFVRWTHRGKKRLVRYLGQWETVELETAYGEFRKAWLRTRQTRAKLQPELSRAQGESGMIEEITDGKPARPLQG